jgi:hypothetical protein
MARKLQFRLQLKIMKSEPVHGCQWEGWWELAARHLPSAWTLGKINKRGNVPNSMTKNVNFFLIVILQKAIHKNVLKWISMCSWVMKKSENYFNCFTMSYLIFV